MNFIPKVFELIKRPTTSKYRSAVYSNVYDKTYDAYHFPGSKRNAQTLVYCTPCSWGGWWSGDNRWRKNSQLFSPP
jgi:hypothetical protein